MAPNNIHDAAAIGDLETVMALVDEDPDIIDSLDSDKSRTALHWASIFGHEKVVGYLLSRGATIDRPQPCHHLTALILACSHGHSRVVDLLLRKGADPAYCSPRGGFTPLMFASANGNTGVVRRLVNHEWARVTIDNGCDSGRTALWWACYWGHASVVSLLLLDGGADPSLADYDNITPREIARRTGHQDCLKLVQVSDGRKQGSIHPLVVLTDGHSLGMV